MNGLFFYDPMRGERIAYDELHAELSVPRLDYFPVLRPASAGDAVRAVAKAVLLRQSLTLFDSDFSAAEFGALGGTDAALEGRESVPGLGALGLRSALEAARHERGFRLSLFTSGSTGLPKSVSHSLEGLTRTLRVGEKHGRSVWGLAYNPTHIAGVQVILQALFNQNPLIHLFGADRGAVRRALVEQGVTHISATPSFYRLLLPVEEPLVGLRAVTLGGERSDAGLLSRLAELFPNARVRNLYASTEAGTILVAEGDVFSVPPELSDRVRLREGQLELHWSLLGEFAAAETAVAEDWYRTGDVVEVVAEKPLQFRFLSRERDWVNVGGHKVNPGEVEETLLTCPGVTEARVYGRPNSVLGHILCAEVVAEKDFSEAAARVWLAERLLPAKIPRLIKSVPALQRTRTGKIARS